MEEYIGMCYTLKTIGMVTLGVILYPLFLVFFSPIVMTYILQSKGNSCAGKFILALFGFILGLILIPFFVVAAVVYTITIIFLELLSCCGCEPQECCSLTPNMHRNNPNYDQSREQKAQ